MAMGWMWKRKTIRELASAERLVNARATDVADFAHLNWRICLEPLLGEMASELTTLTEGGPHRFFVASQPAGAYSFQVNAIANRLLRPLTIDSFDGKSSPVMEEHAALVYSLHVSGMCTVTVHPHRSAWSKPHRESYLVAVYRTPWELLGASGVSRLRKHFTVFLKLVSASMAAGGGQSVSDGRLYDRLERANDRYERLYQSRAEHRRALADAEIALGAGLVGGLIASTIMPFAQTYGAEHRKSAEEARDNCGKNYTGLPELRKDCFASLQANSDYQHDIAVGKLFTTANLLVGALVLSVVAVFVMRGMLKKG